MPALPLLRHQGTKVYCHGKTLLNFTGTAFLGLAYNQRFQNLVAAGMKKLGVGFGGSRLNAFQFEVFERMENKLAKMLRMEEALTINSGFLACKIVQDALEALYPLSKSDHLGLENLHPAWAPSFTFRDWNSLLKAASQCPHDQLVIYAESIQSMNFTSSIPWEQLAGLSSNKKICLVVDDSHGLGLDHQAGCFSPWIIQHLSFFKEKGVEVVYSSSLAKGMGVGGGVIAGPSFIIQLLKKHPAFRASSPVSPAQLWALAKYWDALPGLIDQLHDRQTFFQQALTKREDKMESPFLIHSYPYPVWQSQNESLYSYLMKNGILASCLSYPDEHSPKKIRLVVTAQHQKSQLKKLSKALMAFDCAKP